MKIAQISDMHFGSFNEEVGEALLSHLIATAPDLVVVSGDITQSSTTLEFEQAAAWLARLPMAKLCIPGNHDLPGMNLSRFINPFRLYRQYIADDLDPQFVSPLVHVKGINTARRILPHINWANGSVSRHQCHETSRAFAESTSPWRLFVLHHPMMNSRDFPLAVTVFNADNLLKTLYANRIDIVMAGHQHHAYVETQLMDGHTTLFVNAGTATSDRLRRQPNGFNLLSFTDSAVRIDMLRYNNGAFETFEALTHTKPTTGLRQVV